MKPEFIDIECSKRAFRLEYQWINAINPEAPLVIFLHEGLGSVRMWRDFPEKFCQAIGCQGLVYSRPGYGESSPRPPHEHWGPDFMHHQAREVLPTLLHALGIDTAKRKPWLLGHSDGGSIALLYAALFPDRLAGALVLAPHIFVEDISIRSIEAVRDIYQTTDLRQKLARFHRDPDSAFWGWNDVWLSAEFGSWNIEDELTRIECPVVAIQGLNDEYGSLAQVRGIQAKAPQTQVIELPDCGHSPHKDQAQAVILTAQQLMHPAD